MSLAAPRLDDAPQDGPASSAKLGTSIPQTRQFRGPSPLTRGPLTRWVDTCWVNLKPSLRRASARLLIACGVAVPCAAGAQVYKCTQPDGKVMLSDKECDKGARLQGLEWVDVEKDKRARDEADRQRVAAAERRKRLEQEQAEREAKKLIAERQAEVERRKAAAAAPTARPGGSARSATTDANVDRMTTYAVLLGRAVGCGLDTEAASRRVGAWMDDTFNVEQRKVYLPIFIFGMTQQAEAQRAGRSPDSCSQVRQQFARVNWP